MRLRNGRRNLSGRGEPTTTTGRRIAEPDGVATRNAVGLWIETLPFGATLRLVGLHDHILPGWRKDHRDNHDGHENTLHDYSPKRATVCATSLTKCRGC